MWRVMFVAVAIAAAIGLAEPARASVPYDVWSCRLPDGSPAPTDGWTPRYLQAGTVTDTCTAATSTIPARPAIAPPMKQVINPRRLTARPAILAARILPPIVRTLNPNVVCSIRIQTIKHAQTPKMIPQCTLLSPSVGSMKESGRGKLEGLFRLLGSRMGPLTR